MASIRVTKFLSNSQFDTSIDNLNFAIKLLDDDKYSKSKILDLRIPKRVITYD